MKATPILELVGVDKVYRPGGPIVRAVKNISLKIYKGDFVLIEGKSGSGKTTLLNMLSGVDTPTKGKIIYNKRQLVSLKSKEIDLFRNNNIGMIFQFFNLLPNLTAIQNVSLPIYIGGFTKREAQKKASKALGIVGLKINYDTQVRLLSGGQQQRVAIARAIVNNPSIILCDEPTGNLDSETGVEIIKILKNLNQKNNTTIIIASHDPEIRAVANRIIKIKDGRLV